MTLSQTTCSLQNIICISLDEALDLDISCDVFLALYESPPIVTVVNNNAFLENHDCVDINRAHFFYILTLTLLDTPPSPSPPPAPRAHACVFIFLCAALRSAPVPSPLFQWGWAADSRHLFVISRAAIGGAGSLYFHALAFFSACCCRFRVGGFSSTRMALTSGAPFSVFGVLSAVPGTVPVDVQTCGIAVLGVARADPPAVSLRST